MIKKLFDSFQPTNYQLSIAINNEQMTFNGTVTILGSLTADTGTLELHAKDLEVTSALINGVKAKATHTKQDVLQLSLEEQLKKGDHKIEIAFTGQITEQMHGMYPCYFEHEGKKKMLIATQFESHHAREVFPCIDEPAAKATFDLTLQTPEGENVLANTPAKDQSVSGGIATTVFEQTPRMSPYLLAFVVGEMIHKEGQTKNGIVVRSWASAAQSTDHLDFSLNEAIAYIDFYEDYFGIPYPLEKCDQVALPDFESGAMENWGLITYRESVMLNDPSNPSLSTQQYIALVTAHELAHQWFGNLVTMEWWDDLWLNESFASIMEYIALDAIHPEWHIWEEYVLNDALVATNRDVFSDVQPVRVDVDDPNTIHTLFDPAIVYAKGGKLLKTVHDYIGEDAWRSGLKAYFKKHAYENTTRDDLWSALSVSSRKDIAGLMNDWLEKSGLPLVTVTQTQEGYEMNQQRLLLDGKDKQTTWQIPLIGNMELPLLTERSQKVKLTDENSLLLNVHGTGHFITNYTNPAHKKWVESEITDPKRESTWKIVRLNELIMLARHGDSMLTEALDTIAKTGNEERAAVWSQVSAVLGQAKRLCDENSQTRKQMRAFTYQLVLKKYKELGWEYDSQEDSNTTHMRSTILGLALSSKNEQVTDKALAIYDETPNINDLPAEIRTNLLGVAVRKHKDAENIARKLLKLYQTTPSADLRGDICAALTSTHKESDYTIYLELVKDTSVIRQQDTLRWFIYLLRNRHSREATWQWLEDNWDWVESTFGGSKSYDDFARYSANILGSKSWLKKYKNFFEPKMTDPTLKRAITIGIKEIESRVQWKARDEQAIIDWFAQKTSSHREETA